MLRRTLGMCLGPRGHALAPLVAPRCATTARGAVVLDHVVGDEEVFLGQAEDLLHDRDLVVAERVAVRVRRVGVLRRRPADVAAENDERGAPGFGDALAQATFERVEIVGRLAELHDVPAVRLEALRDVVAVRELRRAVDRDVVVVVDVDEPAEAEVAGERRGLVADALFEVAVAADREHVVVAHLGTEPLAQVRLRDRHADAVGEALAERARRHLDAAGVQALGVARRRRTPLAEVADVVELEAEPA